MSASTSGTLYVVSTPIGNLGDITRRAVEVLRAVPCVAAEDTRRTRALLSHLEIHNKSLCSLNAHSAAGVVAQLAERLASGEDIALVTDAGTPGVSDPGRALVLAAVARGLSVRVVPGPSAVTAAVALSGLVEGPFAFLGFLPRRGSGRDGALQRVRRSLEPVVLFEAPPRVAETLNDLAAVIPDRQAFVGRELTKLHEEGVRGTLSELAARAEPWRGEIVMVIAAAEPDPDADAERRALVHGALRAAIEAGASPSRMARRLAELSGISKRELYERALEWADAASAEPGDGEEA